MFFAESSLPWRPLSKTDHAAHIGHQTTPTSNSILTDSYSSSHSFSCVQTAERYDSMACASVELLLPPGAYQHPASMSLSTNISPGAIVIIQQAATRIAPNVAKSAALKSRLTASSAIPILVPTIAQGTPLLPQHQHPAVPPPSLSQGGRLRFWGYHCGGAPLTLQYLLELPLPPPEPPPAHSLWPFLGWAVALCCLMSDILSLLP